MTLASSDWIDADTGGETLDELTARGGALSAAGRAAAVKSALTLVGQYFASGNQPLIVQAAPGGRQRDEGADLTELLAGLRLRAALAAAKRLHELLNRIVRRATFRYELRQVDSTGAVTGQLDIARYALARVTTTDGTTYPILEVQRSQRTPENTLAAYVIRWLLNELKRVVAASGISATAAEYREYRYQRLELERVLRLPAFAACEPEAAQINRSRKERQLLATVRRRLARREISNPTPYAELASWVERSMRGEPAIDVDQLDWSFYGDRFDTKLFELWCLHVLAEEISRQLATPTPAVGAQWRAGGPAYSWLQYAGKIDIYFQRSLPAIAPSYTASWRRSDSPQSPLRGIPDIVVSATPRDRSARRLAIVDPKLRQRGGPPTEELYKLLGYAENFGLSDDLLGAILFYTTAGDHPSGYKYVKADGGPGGLFALRLNPVVGALNQQALEPLVTAVLALLKIPRLDEGRSSPPDIDGDDSEPYLEARRKELVAFGESLGPGVINASRNRVSAIVGQDRWTRLSADARTMLATADHLGFTLMADANSSIEEVLDFSGPIIGLCASVESVVHDHLIGPAIDAQQPLPASWGSATLGAVVNLVVETLAGVNRVHHRRLRSYVQAAVIDQSELAGLATSLRDLNKRFRIPAAHRAVLSASDWLAAWRVVVGEDQLLARSLDVLGV